MRWNLYEVYKCAILTVIAAMLGAILWQMPPKPITTAQVRATTDASMRKQIISRIPLAYVWDGTVSVQDGTITITNEPLEVEIDH